LAKSAEAGRKTEDIMDKAKILEKSRKEHRNEDIYALQVKDQASGLAVKIGAVVCLIISAIELALFRRLNYESWIIYLVMDTVLFIYKCRKLSRRDYLLIAILNVLLLLAFVYFYIDKLIRG
jgi:hypothetical protein